MRNPARLIVRRLGPADWEEFRQIRLRALAEAPEAFSSTLADAVRLDQREWMERLAGRAQFLALTGPISVGTAGGIQAESCAELISMWVDPSCRRSGV
ncbi:MAG TPA: GNAT family N-acetyltransferase, partial [Candidatus Dormibacteraeota bacterium]